jgi:NAD(P)-dependent dehydrogenase (short-subunit alcohol dehydrogenase family)
MSRLQNKIAVVTGGNSGIGLATAELLAKEGAHVYITGRRQKELDAAVKKIGKNVTAIQSDVSKIEDLDRLYAAIKKQSGHIDILFANAGIAEFAKIDEVTEEHYDRVFNINVKGLLFTVQKALPLIKDGGSIILNASIVAEKGMGAFGVYSATKAAVRSFARSWTNDLRARRIRVNVVSPGIIPTPAFDILMPNSKDQDAFVSGALPGIPLGRTGNPEEIAHAVLFLASEDSSYVTGINLVVDGGMTQI